MPCSTGSHALLDGLARDADIFEVLSGLAPVHPRNDTFPSEVFLHLAADALEWCEASRDAIAPIWMRWKTGRIARDSAQNIHPG